MGGRMRCSERMHHLAHLAHGTHAGVLHVDRARLCSTWKMVQPFFDRQHRLRGLHVGLA